MRSPALLLAAALVLGVAPAASSASRPWTNDHALVVVTGGPDGATGVAVGIGGLRRRTGQGPSVFAVGAGSADGGGMLAIEQGGGPLELTTTADAGGARVTLADSPMNTGEGTFSFSTSVGQLRPGETVVGLVVLGNTRIAPLAKPETTVKSGSVRVWLLQLSGTRVVRLGDPSAGGVAADVVTAGAGVQTATSRFGSPVAGAFVTGGLNLSTASWRAPNGATGRWVSGAATGGGALSFAGPPGSWSFSWAGADAVLGGSPVVWFTTPIGSYWRYFRCSDCLEDPVPS